MKSKFSLVFILINLIFNHQLYAYNYNSGEENFIESDSRLILRISGMGVFSDNQVSSFKPEPKNTMSSENTMLKTGYGAEAAADIFLNNHFAIEIGTAFYALKVNNKTIIDVADAYGNSNYVASTKRDLYGVPINLIAQYHIAPHSKIRPYLGIGYSAAFLMSQIRDFKIKNSSGVVFQLGVDLLTKNDLLITINVKQYLLTSKLSYDSSITQRLKAASKLKINPTTVSIGMGLNF